jgi:hypothetical protein
MPSQPITTWITPWSLQSVNVAGTRTRRHTNALKEIVGIKQQAAQSARMPKRKGGKAQP